MNSRAVVLASVATAVASAAINVSQHRQIAALQRIQAVPITPVAWIIPVALAAASVALLLSLKKGR